jgi:glyoxylase-like metal-dependent hydrolase (beta-lactamase superfamily II)
MKIHAIQTGTVQIKERQRRGEGAGLGRMLNTLRDSRWTQPLPMYAWAIEHPEGVIVVDTGETVRATEQGYFPRWHPFFQLGVRVAMTPEDEIGPQLQAQGIAPGDVRWVVLTHMHTDHAGGLHHFPKSEILVSRNEMAATKGFAGRVNGYLPHRWPAWFAPRLVDFKSEAVGPFPASYPLTKAGDVLLVSTPGHTVGHLSVIVRDGELSYFIAGDTSYTEQYMLDRLVDGVAPDTGAALQTLERINQYIQAQPTVYLPSHDPEAAARLANKQPARVAAPAQ